MDSPKGCCHEAADPRPGRRMFFRLFSGAVVALAAAVSGIPVLGYFLSVRRHRIEWVPLGPVDSFAENETRRVTFNNPLRQPWDGMTSQTSVFVRNHGAHLPDSERFMVLSVHLRAPGLPGHLVSAVGLVHVSLPRGRVPCQWRAGLGTASTRPVSLRLPD